MQRNRILAAILGLAAIGIIVSAAMFFFKPTRVVIDSDRVVNGDFTVAKGERLVLKNGAKLDVRGSLTADGEIVCEDGPLQVLVQNDFTVKNRLSCVGTGSSQGSIAIVVGGSVMMDPKVKVVTNGSIQFVDRAEKLLATPKALEAIFDDTAVDTGAGKRLGPLSKDGVAFKRLAQNDVETPSVLERGAEAALAVVSEPVSAQAEGPQVTISGDWQIVGEGETPPEEIIVQTPTPKINKVLLYFDFGSNSDVALQDLEISGPDGHHGENMYDVCDARGGPGQDAMRFNVRAAKLKIAGFTLNLGYGGDGGIATTKKECDHGRATGGAGGKPGNFKMVASDEFQITGTFDIYPGNGGKGGDATASGRDGQPGCPGEKGGDATATGGKGGDSLETLKAAGSVGGLGMVTIHTVRAGDGGNATATAGNGGNGNACKCGGGVGGKATATAGDGGQATTAGGATSAIEGGDGGDSSATGGTGGAGFSCGPAGQGGSGGAGGASVSKLGVGGAGTTKKGKDGDNKAEIGGNGGNGGDGCGEGKGGIAGTGNPAGTPGSDGKRVCLIDVIRYGNDYIRASSLILANPDACGEKHWHAHSSVPLVNSGTMVSDPNPSSCGFCTLSACPVIQIEEPKSNVRIEIRGLEGLRTR